MPQVVEAQPLQAKLLDRRAPDQAAEVAGKFIASPPKTLAGQRVVVLPAVAVAALAEHLEEFAASEPDGLVFASGRGR